MTFREVLLLLLLDLYLINYKRKPPGVTPEFRRIQNEAYAAV